jgi:hypothetical protein
VTPGDDVRVARPLSGGQINQDGLEIRLSGTFSKATAVQKQAV